MDEWIFKLGAFVHEEDPGLYPPQVVYYIPCVHKLLFIAHWHWLDVVDVGDKVLYIGPL